MGKRWGRLAEVLVVRDGYVRPIEDSTEVRATVTVVRSGHQVILYDVGDYQGRLRLLEQLRAVDVQPEQVTLVVLSHLHWDHALNFECFSSSQFVIAARERASARHPGRDRATPRFLLEALERGTRLSDVECDGPLSSDVRYLHTPGHTAGHLSLVVETSQGTVVLAGDACPQRESWLHGVPDLVFFDEALARSSVDLIRRTADIVVPGHGPAFWANSGDNAGRTFR